MKKSSKNEKLPMRSIAFWYDRAFGPKTVAQKNREKHGMKRSGKR